MISEQQKQEIIRAFQVSFRRDNSADIEKYSLPELRDADAMLGNRDLNAGFRIALLNRIAELQKDEDRSHETWVRGWNLIGGIVIGLVVAWLAQRLGL